MAETPTDWREFVDEMRSRRLRREMSRPAELLERHGAMWRDDPIRPSRPEAAILAMLKNKD